jgi:hypothetical protein
VARSIYRVPGITVDLANLCAQILIIDYDESPMLMVSLRRCLRGDLYAPRDRLSIDRAGEIQATADSARGRQKCVGGSPIKFTVRCRHLISST